jgi:hypothetical protein
MSEEKQIEEMAKDIDEVSEFIILGLNDAFIKVKVACERVAEKLYNAGYRKQSEWISVEERLPDKWGKYLAYRKCHFAPHVDIIRYDTNRSVWCFFDNEWGDCEVNDITHWMPLPEPPKKGGAE